MTGDRKNKRADAEQSIRDYLASNKPATGRLMMGVFEIRTLTEAEHLSTLLAANCPDPDKVVSGIWELLSNAIEHGNLGIDFETKTRLLLENRFEEEIEKRLADPRLAHRVARVEFRHGRSRIRLTVEDAGEGFDYKSFLDAEFSLDRPNGRGIAIASRFCFDRMTYRGQGNRVDAFLDLPRRKRGPRMQAAGKPAPRESGDQNGQEGCLRPVAGG